MNKEHTKKIVLGAFGVIGLLYVYFAFFLGPLSKSRENTRAKFEDLQGKIASSKTDVTKVVKLEENARAATARYEALQALSPEGAPIAWFPTRMKVFFAAQHIDRASVRLESTDGFKERELDGWARYNWIIDLPQADFESLGKAFALLENTNPLLSITKLHIHTGSPLPEFQQVTLTASTIIAKK